MSTDVRIVSIAFAIDDRPDECQVRMHVEGEPTADEVAAMAMALVDALAGKLGMTRNALLLEMLKAPPGSMSDPDEPPRPARG